MKLPLVPLIVVTGGLIAAAVAVALIVGSSGGGGGGSPDTSTVEGYFQALNNAQLGIGDSFTVISNKYPNAFPDSTGSGGSVEDAVGYFKESQLAMGDGVEKLSAIEPPAEVAAQHAALVKAAKDVQTAFADLESGAESVTDVAALETLLNSSPTTAFDDFGAACQALQDLATQDEITINGEALNLNC